MSLTPGTNLGPYEILAPLGAGGMGEVFRARDTRLGREVAIKVLPQHLSPSPEDRARFRREAKAISRLNDPHICVLYDVGVDGDTDYIVMELVEGETLAKRLQRGPLPTADVLKLGAQIADALDRAHREGVVHRDLKPGNVMMAKGGVKLMDFGLAHVTRVVDADGGKVPSTVATESHESQGPLTAEGAVVGTVQYMAPEQLEGKRADARSDLWAVGCVLYEMATGSKAFEGSNTASIISAIMRDQPRTMTELAPMTPRALERAVLQCLAKDREERWQTAGDLRRELVWLAGATPRSPSAVDPASELERLAEVTGKRGPSRRWPVPAAVVLGVGLVVLAALTDMGGLKSRIWPSGGAGAIHSLAVLPLENISRDPEQEYFVDGMTQELITNLGKIGALRVISRSSVMSLKGTRKSLPEVARVLNVDALVEGSVVRSGDRVRITAALIQATPERQLWSGSYERRAQDVLALQTEVTREIAQQIRVRLAPGERERLAPPKPVNTEAYEAHLRGQIYLERFDWEQNRKAIAMFQKAIEIQPTFAPAWAGLAGAHYMVSNVYVPPRDAMPKAREAARRALELDYNLSEAHAVLGAVAGQFDWNWEGAEREFHEAIRLNASNANAHMYYAFLLAETGRVGQGLAEVIRARELNPLSSSTASYVPVFYYWAGQLDSALAISRKLTESEPEYWQHRSMLAACYAELGMYEEAINEGRKMVSLSEGTFGHSVLARAYAYAGRRPEALNELRLSQGGDSLRGLYVWPVEAAITNALLGERDRAFEWLNRAYEDRAEDLLFINLEPAYEGLRSDHRFHDLVRRIGLRR